MGFFENVDDREFLKALFEAMYPELPEKRTNNSARTKKRSKYTRGGNTMGFFDSIFPSMKDMEKAFKEQMEREKQYLQMDATELKMLDDDDLYEAVRVRIDNKVFETEDMAEGLGKLSADEIIFYAVYTLDMEVNNGGLCQFFVNSSRVVAPVIGNCLAVIGAKEHKDLYEGFITKHNIDVTDLSPFDVLDVSDFTKHAESYPFEEYDNAFYELTPLQEYLIPYIRDHIETL